MEADNVTHTILTPDESKVPDEICELLYSKLPIRFWVKAEITKTCWVWTADLIEFRGAIAPEVGEG